MRPDLFLVRGDFSTLGSVGGVSVGGVLDPVGGVLGSVGGVLVTSSGDPLPSTCTSLSLSVMLGMGGLVSSFSLSTGVLSTGDSTTSLTGSRMDFSGSSMMRSFTAPLPFKMRSSSTDSPVCSEALPCEGKSGELYLKRVLITQHQNTSR